MHTRMDNPATIRPFAMDAILALHKATRQGGVPQATLELVHLPAREPDQWLQDLALTWAHAMPSRQAKQTSGFSRWRPGGRRPTGPLPNAPPSRPPRLSPGSATGRTRYPTRSGTRLPDTTMKRGLAALIIAVSTVNLWNRFNVTTRHGRKARKTRAARSSRQWRCTEVNDQNAGLPGILMRPCSTCVEKGKTVANLDKWRRQ